MHFFQNWRQNNFFLSQSLEKIFVLESILTCKKLNQDALGDLISISLEFGGGKNAKIQDLEYNSKFKNYLSPLY